MTADLDKVHGTVCLICNASIGVSTRNSCPIFQINVTSSEQPVANILSVVLGQEIRQDAVHSDIVCKKCYKLCNEVDELQERLTEIKMEINCYYQKTLRKLESGSNPSQDEERDPLGSIMRSTQGMRAQGLRPLSLDKPLSMKEIDDEEDVDGRGIGVDDPRDADFIPSERLLSKKSSSSADNLRRVQEALMNASSPNSLEYRIKLENSDELMEEDDEIQVIEGVDDTGIGSAIDVANETHDEGDANYGSADDGQARPQVARRKVKSRQSDIPNIIPQMIISREGKQYTCLLCPAEEKVQGEARALITHMKEVHNIRIYICDMCGMEFLKRAEMSAHFDEHVANEEGEFTCNVCQRIFNNLRLFCVHKRMHMPQQKSHSCDSCEKTFVSRASLEEHMNTHTGTRPYKCGDCGKEFASKNSAKSHEKTHLDRPRPYKCTQCSKTFVTEQNLIQHEKTHAAVKSFTCNDCGKSFSSARNLEVHTVIHKGYKPFSCRICGKAFARKAEIRDHERTHTGEKPYQCEFCGSTFGQRSNLQSHKRATHYDDKRYQCVECGKAFKRRRLLDYHIKAAHTGERPYKCQICSATFIYPEHFKKHRRIHTGEKPYSCEVCGKAFNSRDNRNAHRFVHSDKKPYECLVCGMGFMRKPQLYNHMHAQGHVNDTIVVNQPRLTSEEDVSTSHLGEQVEMIIPNDDTQVKWAETNALHGVETDDKVFISELKEHVIIHPGTSGGRRRITAGKVEDAEEKVITDGHFSEEVGHLIIDGQVQFADGETLELDEGSTVAQGLTVDGQPLVIPAGRHHTVDGTEFTVETTEGSSVDGSVHLVHISIPESGDNQQWFNIVEQ